MVELGATAQNIGKENGVLLLLQPFPVSPLQAKNDEDKVTRLSCPSPSTGAPVGQR